MIHSLCLEGINSLFEETSQEASNSQGRSISSPMALNTVNSRLLGGRVRATVHSLLGPVGSRMDEVECPLQLMVQGVDQAKEAGLLSMRLLKRRGQHMFGVQR